ncbi:serine hydrolase [Phytohabitans kaempferiae]|uniref:Serine hydrolase n=1 Tax=Phytohabitans kaempferiae TaxID=1620943 RepID=A0ABV6M9X2_9ACTN
MIYLSKAWRRARRSRRRTRLAVAGVALAGVAAALVAGGPVANAHPGQPSAVFDPNEVGWAGLRDRTMVEFDQDLEEWGKRGFYPVDIEVDTFTGAPTFGGAFQYNVDKRAWLVDTVMTEDEYEAKFEQAKKDGLRLVDREVYLYKGEWHIGAAWVANKEKLGWHARFGLTLDEFDDYAKEQRGAKRIPIDFDMFKTSEGVRYGAIFLDNKENLDWHLHGDLSSAEFSTTFDEYDADGFRMLSFDSAPSDEQLYGGIWVENANDRGWRMRRAMTQHEYGNWWHNYVDQGYRQIFVGRYQVGSEVRYAAIWRQNNDRPDWRRKPQVDRIVEQEMAEDDVPGVAVAVMENGTFRYTRGFGRADIAEDEWMDSGHVMRWASVAKAVGGALTMRLHEQGELGALGRDSQAGDHFDDLPGHHEATLEQLASNRGCVRHYAGSKSSSLKATDPEQYEAEKDADALMAQTWYANATAAAYAFHDDPLRWYEGGVVHTDCEPGTRELYSTHGYTILGAALEGATGVGVKDLVRQEISDPLGLETLRQEELGGPPVRRAKIYSGAANAEADPDEITWKTLGGGLESDVRDMARFGTALIDGKIVNDTDHIWDGTAHNWGYAYGWNVGTDGGHRFASKSGGQLGSDAHLLLYPDDGIAIAVLINREELTNSADHGSAIAKQIGALMV